MGNLPVCPPEYISDYYKEIFRREHQTQIISKE
jgi:hypothetical protein